MRIILLLLGLFCFATSALAQTLPPGPPTATAYLDDLSRSLGSDDFATRESAQHSLENYLLARPRLAQTVRTVQVTDSEAKRGLPFEFSSSKR